MFLNQEPERPKVGLGVIVCRNGKVLIGRRRGAHGQGMWGFPGGHLEWGESFEDCASRELFEETGLRAQNPTFVSVTNDVHSIEEKHYVTVFMRVDQFIGEPQLLEPEKCEEWRWFDWDELPMPRFLPIDHLMEQGFHPDGGMSADERLIFNKTKEHVKNKFLNEGSGHDWWHLYRVWKTAKAIAKKERANAFIVELGALLHDIADWKDHDGDLEAGPRAARQWLESLKTEASVIQQIESIVREISFKGAGVETPMSSKEGMIVQDADRLDAMGAIGIARTFTWGGSRGRLMYDPNFAPTMHQSFDDYKKSGGHTINHFYEKLLLLKDRMNTQTAKKIAESRHEFMEQYLDQFYTEWEGEDGAASTKYQKLVRDRIPEIIQSKGERPIVHFADSIEYEGALVNKLFEEAREFQDSKTPEELADLLEVIYALANMKGVSIPGLDDIRQAKNAERGGFQNRIILDETRS